MTLNFMSRSALRHRAAPDHGGERMKRALLTIGLVTALAAGSGAAHAGGTPAQKCSAALRKCIGKLFSSIMVCHSKAALTVDDSTNQECVDAANAKWDTCGA